MKTIWIINYYTGTPISVSNPRYIELAKNFRKANYNVITFNHAFDNDECVIGYSNNTKFVERTYGDSKFVHIISPTYMGNGIRRMWSIFAFAMRLFFYRKKFKKPDIILHNIHTPFDYPIVWVAKSLKARYIAEAWDLWPDDFATFGLISRSNPLMKLFYQIEKKIYYSADELIFTFQGIYDYLNNKGWTKNTGGKIDIKKVHYINNGIDIDAFNNNVKLFPRFDEDINDPNIIKIIYLGSINMANHVKTIIDAVSLLQNDSRYKLFVYGDGKDRESLESYVRDHNIRNVTFKERRIPYEECAWVVSQATINIMNYEKGFGRMGVSSGKLFQYLAAGKPIICNIDIAYDDVITENNIGVAKDIETAEEFAQEIIRIANLPKEEYNDLCQRVQACAQQFDYKVLSQKEINVLEGRY